MDLEALGTNWHVWLVTITLIVAAYIDGRELKVPNWITFPMIASGWVFQPRHARMGRVGLQPAGDRSRPRPVAARPMPSAAWAPAT